MKNLIGKYTMMGRYDLSGPGRLTGPEMLMYILFYPVIQKAD